MSTSVSAAGPVKKMSSCVRPGVLEMRASARRPVRALIRLDFPTLERPAKAISVPRMGGSEAMDAAALAKCHSATKSLRPASISPRVKRDTLLSSLLLLGEQRLDVVDKLDLGAMLAHDHALLNDGERVVPCPIDH